jgi:hypothetical protein
MVEEVQRIAEMVAVGLAQPSFQFPTRFSMKACDSGCERTDFGYSS